MIYFLRNPLNGLVKIGYTNNIKRRKKTLEREHGTELELLKTMRGSIVLEYQVHDIFSALRVKGEWFKYNRRMITLNLDRYYLLRDFRTNSDHYYNFYYPSSIKQDFISEVFERGVLRYVTETNSFVYGGYSNA